MTFSTHCCRVSATFLVAVAALVASAAAAADWRVAGAEFRSVRASPDVISRTREADREVRWQLLSGTLRIADDPRRDEIVIPVSWSARRGETRARSVDRIEFELDVQYRHFLSRSNHGGPYAGPLLRVAHREGHDRRSRISAREERFGAGLVVGVRLPMTNGDHWDLSFVHGRFFGGASAGAHDSMDVAVATDDAFRDVGVLRFGRRF